MVHPLRDRHVVRRCAAIVVVGLVASLASLSLAAPASADQAGDEARLFQLTNESRASNGLGPLSYDPAASNVARRWAEELGRSGVLRHNPNVAAEISAQVTNQWTSLGENVGYTGTVESAQAAYMASTGHRHNILGDFNRVGIGIVRVDGRVWSTIVFLRAPAIPYSAGPITFAPFSSAAALVAQQYTDLLGRPADAGAVGGWGMALSSGQATQASMVASLVSSAELSGLVKPVARLYLAYFGRSPDVAGLYHWVSRLRAGTSLASVSESFTLSPEFLLRYGLLDNRGFVDLVYRNVLHRGADPAGAAYWGGRLSAGTISRGGVMAGFSESGEYSRGTATLVDVIVVYSALLRRAPDASGLAYWMGQLQAGAPLARLAVGLLGSSEYLRRF